MATKLIKFIIMRPNAIPQYLEIRVNPNENIQKLKEELFRDDIKKNYNVRIIYMGKVLDDKKCLGEYLNFYEREFLSSTKKDTSTSLFEKRKEVLTQPSASGFLSEHLKNDINKKSEMIPITVHVKITENESPPKNNSIENKNIHTLLGQIAMILLLACLWICRYNYADAFPNFSRICLIIITIFILLLVFHFYVVLFLSAFYTMLVIIFKFFKNKSIHIYRYILKTKERLCFKASILNKHRIRNEEQTEEEQGLNDEPVVQIS